MTVIIKNSVFPDVMSCGVLRLLVTANVVPISPILVTLTTEALRSSETSVLIRATRRNIPENGILQLNIMANLQIDKKTGYTNAMNTFYSHLYL
jgi:hypothetical protein